jgi:uncharacterized protein (DUF1778 family)
MTSQRASGAPRSMDPKSERLAVRVSREQRALLVDASRAQATTVTEFVLKAATQAAQDVMADRRRFVLDEPDWVAFVSALEAAPRELPRLRSLLSSLSVLDEA